jgi:hypothetical protein
MPSRPAFAAVAAGLLAAGCVIVPVQTQAYDPDCQVVTRHIELQPVVLGRIQQCGGQGCEAMVLVGLGVTAASVVISGSIAVVGNVAYWAEHRASCVQVMPGPPTVVPPPTAPPPAPLPEPVTAPSA